MKKILFILMAVTLFSACSKDDDNSNGEEKILGTWFVVEANNIPNFTVDDCTSQSNITFKEDNSADSEFYGNVEGECESQSSNSGWSGDGSRYTFNVPSFGPLTGTVTFNSTTRFTFIPDVVAPSNGSIVFEK